MRFSAAMTAERFLPQRLALRARPPGRIVAVPLEAATLPFAAWRKTAIMAMFFPAKGIA